jgi:uncharacterized protein YndB with AHSA1/START domain
MSDGTVEQLDGDEVRLRFERRLGHPVERVWAAITDPERLIEWWGDASVELRDGGPFTMRWLNKDPETGEAVEMRATITALDPPRLIEMAGDPHGTLRFELEGAGDGTTDLTFTSTLALPDEFRTMVLAGWHYHLDALAAHLDGGSTDLVSLPNEQWEAIRARYEGASH